MAKFEISFFCPAYNDQKNLPRLIPEVVNLLGNLSSSYEILIIEDGSPDNTGQVADQLAEKYKNVRVIHHLKNLGYGATLAEGFREANNFGLVFYTDGDRQYQVSELTKFLDRITDCDAVIGYRINKQMSVYRKFQSALYNFVVKILFGINFKDIDCSMKLIKRQALNKIELHSKSSLIDAELLIKLSRQGARIAELPVTHLPREFGRASGAKFSVVAKTIFELFKLRLGIL